MFNRKKIKSLERELELHKEEIERYKVLLRERDNEIKRNKRFYRESVPIRVSYTITESDVLRYNLARMPRVAKDRLSMAVASAIKKNFDPVPVFDDNGLLVRYEYIIDVRQPNVVPSCELELTNIWD